MTKLKKLAQKHESKAEVEFPVSSLELVQRAHDYNLLDAVAFGKKYRHHLFNGVVLKIDGVKHTIQANFCLNPFCQWYGLPQHKYELLKSKPSRYKLEGSYGIKRIACNYVPDSNLKGAVVMSKVHVVSNWSLAEEIKRLIDINSISLLEGDYEFHNHGCTSSNGTPYNNEKGFYKRGKSTSNSQKYQCKTCGKYTNVLPSIRESFSYHQKKNDILPRFMLQIVNRTPVTRTLEQLNIGASTYYHKLEWVYRRCLEFLEKHETQKLKNMKFRTLWLNTDKLVYNLNNVRKKGKGTDYKEQERPLFPTHVVATVDEFSRYAFRTDVAFDFNINSDDILQDIEDLKEDKLYSFAQKNARYRYSYYGKNKKDELYDSIVEDNIDSKDLELRKAYVDGFHVNSGYTAYAQQWLLKQQLNANKINFVCDDDDSLKNAILRVYSDDIKAGKVNLFTCTHDKTLSSEEAFKEYIRASQEHKEFQQSLGLNISAKEAAILMLADDIADNPIYGYIKTANDVLHPIKTRTVPIEHPTPFLDEGFRYIDCETDLSSLTPHEIAKMLYNVNLRAINTYFNQIRRRVSILERPLEGGRGDGKSYIYANFNPKYAQYMLTIVRTYINFCDTYKHQGKKVTPAMRLGLADKPFTVHDILYFK